MSGQTRIGADRFYQAYNRSGDGTVLAGKHIRQFDKDFAAACGYRPGMSVLELGCGNGLFLRYLEHRGVEDFCGVDGDPRVIEAMPESLRPRVHIADFADFLAGPAVARTFDRVVLFDVLEHFSPDDAVTLLGSIGGVLAADGQIVVRVPNVASPFGLNLQYNDVTHRTAFTPGSLRQVARAAGFEEVSIGRQAYSSRRREIRERLLTGVLSWFLAMPPSVWTPAMIGVLARKA